VHPAACSTARPTISAIPGTTALPSALTRFTRPSILGGTDVLAGEPAADEVGRGNAVASQSPGRERSHVVVEGNAGPVPGEDAPAPGIALAERDGPHSRPGKAKAETTDAAEQVKDAHGRGSCSSPAGYGFTPGGVKPGPQELGRPLNVAIHVHGDHGCLKKLT